MKIKRASSLLMAMCIITGGVAEASNGVDYYLIKDKDKLIHMSVEEYSNNFSNSNNSYYRHFLKDKYLEIEYLIQKMGSEKFSDDKYVYINDFLKAKTSNSQGDLDVMEITNSKPYEELKDDLYKLSFENEKAIYTPLRDDETHNPEEVEKEKTMIENIKKMELFFVRDEYDDEDKNLYKHEYLDGTIYTKEINKNWHTPAQVEKIEIKESANKPDENRNILDSISEIDLYYVGNTEMSKDEIKPSHLRPENRIQNFKYKKGEDFSLPIIFDYNGQKIYYGNAKNTNSINDSIDYESKNTEFNTYIARVKFEYGNTMDIGLSTEFRIKDVPEYYSLEELKLGK